MATTSSSPTSPARPADAADEFVLPAGRRQPAPPLILAKEEGAAIASDGPGLQAVGRQLQPLFSCLLRLHRELGDAVAGLGEAIADDPRAALAGRVGHLAEILQWVEAVSLDLRDEIDRAAGGLQPVDTADCLLRLAWQLERDHPGMRVTVTAESVHRCWGEPEALGEMLRLALELTRARIGGAGGIAVEIAESGGFVNHRILGLGDPCALDAPELTSRFTGLAHATGATVKPDHLGPGGTGIVVGVPVERWA